MSSVLAKVPVFTSKELKSPPPRLIRTCCSFGVDLQITGIPFMRKTAITSIDNLGKHQYLGDKKEGNGIVYTQRGGFIDIGHLRDYADWTAYLYSVLIDNNNNSEEIIIDLGSEGGPKSLIISLKEEMTEEDYYQLAGKMAYDLSLWHEIATWFGTSYIPFVPERYSSFSPEDLYSNLLGVKLGIMALRSEMEFAEAMTKYLREMLIDLVVVPTFADTYVAMNRVKDVWWTSKKKLPSRYVLLDRYFDSPADDFLVPWTIPNQINVFKPYELEKPKISIPNLYQLRIKTNYKFPMDSILTNSQRRDITQKDFGSFIRYIETDVLKPENDFFAFFRKRKSN